MWKIIFTNWEGNLKKKDAEGKKEESSIHSHKRHSTTSTNLTIWKPPFISPPNFHAGLPEMRAMIALAILIAAAAATPQKEAALRTLANVG